MSSPIPPAGTSKWTVDALGNNQPRPEKTSTPPGFVTPGLWSENDTTSTTEGGDATSSPRQRSERSSSFNNIAAALGNGLAESMEDATRGDHLSKSHHESDLEHNESSNVPTNLTDSFFNRSNNSDMTYERHKRHAASRLLGAAGGSSSSPISHKVPEAGSLFGAVESAENASASFVERHADNQTRNDINDRKLGGHRSIGMESSPTASSPFSHDPTGAAFHPSYEKTTTSSSSQFNNDHTKNSREIERIDHCNSRLPATKDLGLTVMEPSETPYGDGGSSKISSRNFTHYGSNRSGKSEVDITYGIQADMQNLNLWSDSGSSRGVGGSMSLKSPSPNRAVERNEGASLGEHLRSPLQGIVVDAEDELRPYTWDRNHHEPSRTLTVLNVSSIQPNEIISFCENFGITEAFRSEFLDALGVVFISFFDMRCAQFAAMQLPTMLERLVGGSGRIQVKFCVPLNSSSQNDESLVVINDLPHQISSESLGRILSSFGAIRSLKNLCGGNYGGSFVVEFHDIQDARKVVFELESTQPWGPEVSIEVGGRNPTDRKKGRELLAMLGRWRSQGGIEQGRPLNRGRQTGKGTDTYRPHTDSRALGHRDVRYERGFPHEDQTQHHSYGPVPQDGRYPYGNNTYVVHHQHPGYPQYRGIHHASDNLVHSSHHTVYSRPHNHQPPPRQQQFYQQHQQISHGNIPPGGSSVISGGSSRHTGTSGYYTDDRSIGSHNSNLRSVNSIVNSMAGDTRDGQSQHLVLDLDAVENGLDTRTSLMVRNIPNKYTQQMLLTEFTENDHGPGIIDFFYLPIDFKNRCNRGYAFINFVDYHDILNFHRQYYGQHWRTFNSDKICDITYARIQGKAAMLKRFENSALMEKDEEYKPLVFVSSGPDRGTRLPFPDSSRGS